VSAGDGRTQPPEARNRFEGFELRELALMGRALVDSCMGIALGGLMGGTPDKDKDMATQALEILDLLQELGEQTQKVDPSAEPVPQVPDTLRQGLEQLAAR
jgi:hypothetical protein